MSWLTENLRTQTMPRTKPCVSCLDSCHNLKVCNVKDCYCIVITMLLLHCYYYNSKLADTKRFIGRIRLHSKTSSGKVSLSTAEVKETQIIVPHVLLTPLLSLITF